MPQKLNAPQENKKNVEATEIEINNYWTEFVQFENVCKSITDRNRMKCKKKYDKL